MVENFGSVAEVDVGDQELMNVWMAYNVGFWNASAFGVDIPHWVITELH